MSDHGSEFSGPRIAPVSVDPPARLRQGFNINVHRQGCVVNLSLTAGDEYGAMELYEHFVRSLERGRLSLDIS